MNIDRLHLAMRWTPPLFLICILAFAGFFWYPGQAQAVTRTWDGGGVTNNWSEDANWSGDIEPGASDLATFDDTSVKDVTIDTSISVGGILVSAGGTGYTGVITQASGSTVTVGSQNFVISAGTFTGSDSTITVNGAFTVSGGLFTSTTNTLSITGAFTVSSGSFDPSTGTVSATGSGNPTWNVVTSETFNNLIFAKNNGTTLTISSGDTFVVLGALTLTDGAIATGTIDTRGNTSQALGFDGGTAVIDFGDDGVAQSYTLNGGTAPTIRLDAPGDSAEDATPDSIVFAAASTITVLNVTSGFTGTIPISNASDFAMTVGTWTQNGGTFNGGSFSTLTLTSTGTAFTIGSGATFNAPDTINVASTGMTWDVNSSQTVNNLTVSTTSGFTITSTDTIVTDGTFTMNGGAVSSGTLNANGNIVQNGGSAGTTTINFNNDSLAQTYTINGGTGSNLRLDSVADASDSIVYAATGRLNTLTTTADFVGDIPISNPSDFAMSFNNWSQSGGVFTANYCGGICSTMNLGSGTTTFTIVSPASFTAPTTINVSSTGMTWDVTSPALANSLTVNNLTTSTTVALTLNSLDTVVVDGTLTLSAGALSTSGAAGTGIFNVNGNIVQSSGSSSGTATVNFNDDLTAQTYTINGGTGPNLRFDDNDDATDTLVYAAAGGLNTLTTTSGFTSTVNISNPSDFTMTFGNWSQSGGNFSADYCGGICSNMSLTGSSFVINSPATFTAPTTISTGSAGTTWNVDGTQTVNNLTTSHTVAFTITPGDTIVTTGTYTRSAGSLATGTLEAQGNVVYGASGTVSSLLKFTGAGTQTFSLSSTGSQNADVTVDKTGGQVSMITALVLDAASVDLTIVEGTFDIAGNNLTVNGTSATFVVQDGGVFERFGAETVTLNASNPTLQTGSTVRYTGDGDAASDTYTVTTLATTYSNLAIASTDGTTDTFQLGAALDVNGSLTNSGTFSVTGSNHQINVGGDWTNTGTFQPNSGTVIFDGTNQTLSGATSFNSFTKTVASAATLTFPTSTAQTFSGALTLNGASAADRLLIRSNSSGVQASIDPSGSRSVSYLDVQDSNNINATAISCGTGCLDSGNNINWLFPGISVGAISGNTTEAGVIATFSVVLLTQPSADVTIPVSSSDTTEGTVAITDLTFTNGNWSTPQEVTVTGVNDDVDDGNIVYTIILGSTTSADVGYSGLDPADVSVTNTDNDTAGVTITESSGTTNVSEAGATDDYTIVLNSEPTANVTVTVTTDDDVDTTPTFVTFTSGDWFTPQSITVSAVDDAIDETDPHTGVITHTAASGDGLYDGISIAGVNANVADNDTSTISVSAISGNTTEAGATATFTVVLEAVPTDNVTMSVTSSDTSEITVDQSSLTFTSANWNTPQTVTVTGVDDDIDDGDQAVQVLLGMASSTDLNYNGLDPADVDVLNVDNDTAGVTITESASSTDVTEGGVTDSYTVVLTSEPTADVTINLTSDDDVTVDDNSLIFTAGNWFTEQTITVTAVDDDIDETSPHNGVISHAATSADLTYNGIVIASVTSNVTDNDTAGATVSSVTGDTTEAGGTASATIVLTSEPTASVSFAITSLDTSEVTVTAGLTFTSADWATPQTVTFTGVNDAVDDGDQIVGVTVDAGTSADPFYNGLDPDDFTVTNVDDDGVGVSITQSAGTTDVEEGGATDSYDVVLDTEPTDDVTITVTDTAEATATPASLVFTSITWATPQAVTVTAVNDTTDDVSPDATIFTHSASSTDLNYDGISIGSVTVNVTDNDVPPSSGSSGITPLGLSIEVPACVTGQLVNITLTAQQATEMLISIDGVFDAETWLPFESNFAYMLPAVDGEYTFYVRFRSNTGDVSQIITASAVRDSLNGCLPVTSEPETETPPVTAEPTSPPAPGTPIPEIGCLGIQQPDVLLTGIIDVGPSPITGLDEPINAVNPGDYIRSANFDTVYCIIEDGVRRPFVDTITYFTYERSFDRVKWVTDATLASLPLGSPVLPNPATILVKFVSDPAVYKMEVDPVDRNKITLRHVLNEQVAYENYGKRWADYIIDVNETLRSRFIFGEPITGLEPSDTEDFRARQLLNEESADVNDLGLFAQMLRLLQTMRGR